MYCYNEFYLFLFLMCLLEITYMACIGLPTWHIAKESACQIQETQVRSLGWEDSLQEVMAPCSSILAWVIPWTEEPGGLQWVAGQTQTKATEHTYAHARGTGQFVSHEAEAQ